MQCILSADTNFWLKYGPCWMACLLILTVTWKRVIFFYRDKWQSTVSKYKVRWKLMHAFRSYDYYDVVYQKLRISVQVIGYSTFDEFTPRTVRLKRKRHCRGNINCRWQTFQTTTTDAIFPFPVPRKLPPVRYGFSLFEKRVARYRWQARAILHFTSETLTAGLRRDELAAIFAVPEVEIWRHPRPWRRYALYWVPF